MCHILHLKNPYVAQRRAPPSLHALCLHLAILQATLRRVAEAQGNPCMDKGNSSDGLEFDHRGSAKLRAIRAIRAMYLSAKAWPSTSCNLPNHAYLWSSPNDMKGPASLWPRFPCQVPAEKVVLAREDEEQHQVLMAFTLCRLILLVAMPAWIPVSCQLHRSSLSS